EKPNSGNGALGATIEFKDPSLPWLTGINDQDGETPYNWILSGTSDGSRAVYGDFDFGSGWRDPNEDFEGYLGGIIAPYGLVGFGTGDINTPLLLNKPGYDQNSVRDSKLEYLNSTVIV